MSGRYYLLYLDDSPVGRTASLARYKREPLEQQRKSLVERGYDPNLLVIVESAAERDEILNRYR